MLHLYSKITGAFHLSAITLWCLGTKTDLEIQNDLNVWETGLS